MVAASRTAEGRAGEPQPAVVKTDIYGDPLPPGAVARLGTVQRKAVQARTAITPDGKTFVTASPECIVRLWNVADGKLRETIDLLPAEISTKYASTVALASDGSRLAISIYDGGKMSVEVWSISGRKRLTRVAIAATSGVFSPDGTQLAVAYTYGPISLRILDLTTNQISVIATDKKQECHFAFSRDGKRLVAAFWNEVTVGWDVPARKQLWSIPQDLGRTWTFAPDGNRVVYFKGRAPTGWHALDAATGQPAATELKLPQATPDDTPVFAPDGRTLVIPVKQGQFEHDAIVWDGRDGRERSRLTQTSHIASGANHVGPVAPDGRSVFAGEDVLQRWDLESGKAVFPDGNPLGHYSEVNQLVFFPDGKRLASRAWGWDMRIWDVPSRKIIHNLAVDDLPWKMTLTPDGTRLVSAAGERLTVWDTATGRQNRKIGLNLQGVAGNWVGLFDVRATPDSRHVIATTRDRSSGRAGNRTSLQIEVDLQSGEAGKTVAVPERGAVAGVSRGLRWRVGAGTIVDWETGKEHQSTLVTRTKTGYSCPRFRTTSGWRAASSNRRTRSTRPSDGSSCGKPRPADNCSTIPRATACISPFRRIPHWSR